MRTLADINSNLWSLELGLLKPKWFSDGHNTAHHRVDHVIESSLQEILGRKHFALINLSWYFIAVIIKEHKVIPENMVAVR